MNHTWFCLCLVLITLLGIAHGASLQWSAPHEYEERAPIEVKVNKLESVSTQIPYSYYSLPFCVPNTPHSEHMNLGEVLMGDVIQHSDYELQMNVAESCKVLCVKSYSPTELSRFKNMTRDNYRVNFVIDGLPSARKRRVETHEGPKTVYERGFRLGLVHKDKVYLHNHVRFNLLVHTDASKFSGYRIVGFEVEPFSVKHKYVGTYHPGIKLVTCNEKTDIHHQPKQSLTDELEGREILWTYDVSFESSETAWPSRWDMYVNGYVSSSSVHWMSIVNSLVIVLVLAFLVALIMIRLLRRDVMRYNEEFSHEEQVEDLGWKAVHTDVFRPPTYPQFFSILVGSGAQVLAMALPTLILGIMHVFVPSNRGYLLTVSITLFCLMGIVAGFISTYQFNKIFLATNISQNRFCTALFFPSVFFTVLFILNLVLASENSSQQVPFGDFVLLLAMWLGLDVPLVYIGSKVAIHRPILRMPTKCNILPREVPKQPWFNRSIVAVLIGGLLPFIASFMEIMYLMSSVWHNQYFVYYMFSFLFVVFITLLISCMEVSIVSCYFQLVSEDYRWWWRAFLTSGASAAYVYLYCFYYYFTTLEDQRFVSGILYFGYMFLFACIYFVLTGVVGYFATLLFVRKIYGSTKFD